MLRTPDCVPHAAARVPILHAELNRSAMPASSASLTEQLARRLRQPVDAPARRRAALLMVDWLGCALGASRYPLAAQLRPLVRAQPPDRKSVV